jgi:hypothetical protein
MYRYLLLLLLVGCRAATAQPVPGPVAIDGGVPPAPPAAPVASPATPPRAASAPVAVAIVVDQLAAWVLRERIDRLPPDGGFARLRREGKYFREMAFRHANTETGPGHASLFTGRLPREHGIVANDVVGADGTSRSLLADEHEGSPLVTLDARPVVGPGYTLDALEAKASLVAAAFRSRYAKGQGVVAALSLKERGALLAAGESADYAVWFDPTLAGGDGRERGGFVAPERHRTSLAKSPLAAFVAKYLLADPTDLRDGVARLEDEPWVGLDRAWLRANAGAPAAGDYAGFLDSHTAGHAAKPGAAFRALPASDRLLLELALRIVAATPKQQPVFLAVSLSANDMIGHLFGPDSWEAWDELRRLDGALAWFMAELDQWRPRAWSLVLSADHGTAPTEDSPRHPVCGRGLKAALASSAPCSGQSQQGARIFSDDLVRAAEATASLRDASGAGLGRIVAGVAHPYLYLTPAAKQALAGDAAARTRLAGRLDRELRRRFKSVHGVLDVAPLREADTCPDERRDPLAALVCHSVSPMPDRGGDFYLVLKPGAFLDADLVRGRGASHGSPYGYDRIVPLLVRDPRRPELAGQVEDQQVPFTLFHDELVRIILSAPAAER